MANTSRRQTYLLILLAAVILLAVVVFRASSSGVVNEDATPVEFALGDYIGRTIAADPGCTEVFIVDTDWKLPHLRKLAAGRKAGLLAALPKADIHWYLAEGPDDRAKAYERAAGRTRSGTTVVVFNGLTAKAPLPAEYRSLIVIGEADGGGLPGAVLSRLNGKAIKPRAMLSSPVNSPRWKGTVEERFTAAYEVKDLVAKPARGP